MKGIEELARYLAINYYNLSVSEANYTYDKTYRHPGIEAIFNKPLENEEDFAFSRNILLIGAGGSKSTYKFIETAHELINNIQKDLNLYDFLHVQENPDSPRYLWNKYVQLINYHKKQNIFNEKYTLDEIHKTLSFEERLQLLKYFFRDEDIFNVLKKNLGHTVANTSGTRYLPSFFYEMIAHFFKHRFIDVIVNMNFDELLDNSIEDELGSSTYVKIIDEANCPKLEKIVDNNRLKIPIYIKPHGTIQSSLSLRFTNNQYIDQATEINDLLTNIFSGYVGDQEKCVRNFNIIIAGYRFDDSDIQNVLFGQLLKDSVEKVNYFVFDREADEFKDKFFKNFSEWLPKQKLDEQTDEYKEKLVNKIKSFHCITCDSNYEEIETEDKNGLGVMFKELYREIQLQFKKPFIPRSIIRHEILSMLFPRFKVTKNTMVGVNAEEYFRLRARSSCLYELIKYKGKMPINALTNDRPGNYQKRYIEQIIENKGKMNDENNLIGFLRANLGSDNIKIENSYVTYRPLAEADFEKGDLKSILEPIVTQMVTFSYVTRQNIKNKIRDKIIQKFIESMRDGYSYNINAIYDDPKHGRFYSFEKECIINTDLELTWKFFDFTVNRHDKWDKLYIIGNTGKSLLNLYLYGDSNYLKNISGKLVHLIYTHPNPQTIDKDGKTVNIIAKISEFLGTKKFTAKYMNDEIEIYRMALYCKGDNPVFGIYFFKPSTKNRINPVYFDTIKNPKNTNLQENLLMMLHLFEHSKNIRITD